MRSTAGKSLPATNGLLNGTNLVILVIVVIANLLAIVPSARVSDRIGRKPVIYASCLVGAAGLAIAAIAPSIPVALVMSWVTRVA